jgi:hypothetical protein
VELDWTTCEISDCIGAPTRAWGHCWEHQTRNDEDDALTRIGPGTVLDVRGTTVTSELLKRILDRFRDSKDRPRLNIGIARCKAASFVGPADFGEAIFGGDAEFAGATFRDAASFAGARFKGSADFAEAEFVGPAIFTSAGFCRPALFNGARFGVAQFADVWFGGGPGGSLSFAGASVATKLTLKVAEREPGGTLILDGLRGAGEVDVRAEVGTVDCKGAEFGGRVSFRLAGSPAFWLTDTAFEQPSTVESWPRFASAPADDPGADDARPVGKRQVDPGQITVRSLRGVDAEHLTLADADLAHCLILGLRRPEELRLAGRCQFPLTPRGWHFYRKWPPLYRWTVRDTLYEERLWRRASKTAAFGWITDDAVEAADAKTVPRLSAASLAVLYRQLRQAIEDARNEPGAADLYYGEMEMRRLSTPRRDERLLLTLYWLVSGYGLRASRAMLVLTALVLVTALVLARAGFPGHHAPGYLDCLLYASGSLLSLDLPGHLPATLTDWGQLIRIVLRIGGPVLLGLGALAVRGRLKR